MVLTIKKAVIFLLLTMASLFLFNLIFIDDELIGAIGTSLFPVIVGLLSLAWVYKAYKIHTGQAAKYFWMLLCVGLIVHVIGNLIWFSSVILADMTKAPRLSYVFWLVSYFLFLSGLIYKVRLISPSKINNPYLFNTIIFLISTVSIFVYYLVRPFWVSTESLFDLIVIGFLYPVADIGIMFVITQLYYLTRRGKEKTIMLFLMAAFYLQILGDVNAAIMKTNKEYYQLLIEPKWVGSLLLIGFAGLFAQKSKLEFTEIRVVEEKESSLPYLFASLLMVVMFYSNQWKIDELGLGLAVVFLLIIGRQLFIIHKNRSLMIELRKLAYQDSLTGLGNRSSFQLDLESVIKRAELNNQAFSLLLIDLDRFKMINDTLGHYVGDRLLQTSAHILKNSLEANHHMYRLGGDEFVVMVEEATTQKCIEVSKTILEVYNQTFSINCHEISITPSIGISLYPDHGKDSDSLFKAADAAMYLAKSKGKNNYQFYNTQINQILSRKLVVENELRKAIARNELELCYQPKFNLKTRKIVGMEALLRWNSKELGYISPNEFIPIAEDTGLIMSIGEWVLKRACIQNKEWQDKGYPSLSISVNVSVQQFKTSNIVKTVEDVLRETGLNAKYIELEITESIIQNEEESKKILKRLGELGIKIALDDFGTGYSSLHILKELPIDILKIDKSFIDDITEVDDHSMIKGIIDIASNLNLEIVAEGVEHEYQVKALTTYHCDYGQGYYFAKPITALQIENTYFN
jgi:diguanylate cyclase (GGDEF)-like protein